MKHWLPLVLATALAGGQPTQAIIAQTVAALHLHPGMVVGEALSPELDSELTRAVGPLGKVVRIHPDDEGDPHLQVASLHLAIISDTVLRLPYPERTLAHIRSAIRPEGHLFVRTTDPSVARRLNDAGFESVPSGSARDFLLEFVRP